MAFIGGVTQQTELLDPNLSHTEVVFYALVHLEYYNFMYFFYFADDQLYKKALAAVSPTKGTVALLVGSS